MRFCVGNITELLIHFLVYYRVQKHWLRFLCRDSNCGYFQFVVIMNSEFRYMLCLYLHCIEVLYWGCWEFLFLSQKLSEVLFWNLSFLSQKNYTAQEEHISDKDKDSNTPI
jgi:hypothetical protein